MKRQPKKPSAKAIVSKQQATVAALINSATHYLGETAQPYVVLIGGHMLSNVNQTHARAMVMTMARLCDKCDELEIERAAERLTGFGNGDSNA